MSGIVFCSKKSSAASCMEMRLYSSNWAHLHLHKAQHWLKSKRRESRIGGATPLSADRHLQQKHLWEKSSARMYWSSTPCFSKKPWPGGKKLRSTMAKMRNFILSFLSNTLRKSTVIQFQQGKGRFAFCVFPGSKDPHTDAVQGVYADHTERYVFYWAMAATTREVKTAWKDHLTAP